MPVDLGVHLPIRGQRDMKLKPWIHSALHIGCVALLLLQAHRIQRLRHMAVDDHAHEEFRLQSTIGFAGETAAQLETCLYVLNPHLRNKAEVTKK
jgi:hypothetical protein